MCFLALSSIRADNGWALTTEITPVIAKLILYIRSMFLFHIHIDQEKTGTLCECYQTLECWYYEGEESTFHELYMLQYIAFSIAYTTPSLPAFIWYNEQYTKFIWHGSKIILFMLREMGQILLQWMHNKFIQDILLGNPCKITGHIADDLSNTKPGYSFVSDPRNHKFYNRNSFITLVIDSPRLQDEFVIAIAEDGTPLMNLG